MVPPVSHSLLITSEGGEGGHFNENGPHHKSRFEQVHPQFRLKDKNSQIIQSTAFMSANTPDKIRFPETVVIPTWDRY